MPWSLNIARFAGADVRIYVTLLLFLAWIGFSYYQIGVATTQGVLFMMALFGCVRLHEFGHALTVRLWHSHARHYAAAPGGAARLQRLPDKPWQGLAMAIAGSLVNVFLAAGLIFVLRCCAFPSTNFRYSTSPGVCSACSPCARARTGASQ